VDLWAFLEKQGGIYERSFRQVAAKVAEDGLLADPNVVRSRGGFFIVLRHPLEVASAAEWLSREVEAVVPSIVYNAVDVHTTISDHLVRAGVRVSAEGDEQHRVILEALAWGVRDAMGVIRELPKPCRIDFGSWLFNQTCVIAQGVPNESFVRIAQLVVEACNRRGFKLRLPWGAHMTVSRFASALPAWELVDFLELMKTAQPLGMSQPVSIDVGSFHFEGSEFKLTVHESFPLQ
jgi:hypothetical protein